MLRQVYGFFYVHNFMVGVLGSLRTCRFLDPILQPGTPTTRGMQASGGSNLITVKEAIMPDSNIAHLRPAKNTIPFQVPETTKVIDLEELVLNLPEFLETAISYILADFDYQNNTIANIAVAVRLLGTMADRLRTALEHYHE